MCVPSRREGYGFSAREAMAYGRPVVATRVGGLADLGEAATFVEERDSSALRAVITELLADPARRRQLGDAARRHAEASFSARAAAEQLVAAYSAAIAG